MKAIKKYDDGTELNLYHVQAVPSGYGHKLITVELEYRGKYAKFKSTTHDMSSYDEANGMEGEDKQLAFYNMIDHKIQDELTEWMLEVDSNLEEESFDKWAKENLED